MLVLQDVDSIMVSTESTSILTDATLIGVKKTRAMADWAERCGFQASIQERLFDADFRRRPDEQAVALCGLDNTDGFRADRQGLESGNGFHSRVVLSADPTPHTKQTPPNTSHI